MTTQIRQATSDIATAWACTEANHYDAVADDNDATYININANNAIDEFGFSAFSVPTGATGISVKIFYRRYWINTSSCRAQASIWVNGTRYEIDAANGAGQSVPEETTVEWATNPNTAAAWTVADVNGTGANPLQYFGHQCSRALSGTIVVVKTYIYVEYTPAPSAETVTGNLPTFKATLTRCAKAARGTAGNLSNWSSTLARKGIRRRSITSVIAKWSGALTRKGIRRRGVTSVIAKWSGTLARRLHARKSLTSVFRSTGALTFLHTSKRWIGGGPSWVGSVVRSVVNRRTVTGQLVTEGDVSRASLSRRALTGGMTFLGSVVRVLVFSKSTNGNMRMNGRVYVYRETLYYGPPNP